jgi:shikimate kinase
MADRHPGSSGAASGGRPAALKRRLGGRNIYLVGMMGCGKSTVGRPLAQALGYRFCDADSVIAAAAGCDIPGIFQREGEQGFRHRETAVLNGIARHHSLVVATGGGIVTRPVNWGHMHQGVVVWLDAPPGILLERLQADRGGRPLLEEGDPAATLARLLRERRPLYAEADVHLPLQRETPQEVSEKLLTALWDRIAPPSQSPGGSSRTANH